MYKDLEVSYLTSESDSINAYEARGKKAPGDGSQYEQGMKALSTMDRVQQVEVIQGLYMSVSVLCLSFFGP